MVLVPATVGQHLMTAPTDQKKSPAIARRGLNCGRGPEARGTLEVEACDQGALARQLARRCVRRCRERVGRVDLVDYTKARRVLTQVVLGRTARRIARGRVRVNRAVKDIGE